MSDSLVNCGRCALLWNRDANHPGFGRCASQARQEQTGQIRPLVDLTATCEWAQLSVKFDPDFLPRLRVARREAIGLGNSPTILDPSDKTEPPTTGTDASKTETSPSQNSFQD